MNAAIPAIYELPVATVSFLSMSCLSLTPTANELSAIKKLPTVYPAIKDFPASTPNPAIKFICCLTLLTWSYPLPTTYITVLISSYSCYKVFLYPYPANN